jgi:hypothetical protein
MFAAFWTHHTATQPWLCDNTAAFVHCLHVFNATPPLAADNHGIDCYDFNRLFSNIDQADLILVMDKVIDSSMEFKNMKGIAVDFSPSVAHIATTTPAKYTAVALRHIRTGAFNLNFIDLPYGRRRFMFNITDCKLLFKILVQNSFIQFGPFLVKQVKGVPMGIPPAPAATNLYLGWYEYQFILQAQAHVLLLKSVLTNWPNAAPDNMIAEVHLTEKLVSANYLNKRFLDDLGTINNPLLK